MCRFTLFGNSELMNSYFWYLYYLPIIFTAVFGFLSAMLVEKNEEQARQTLKKYSFVPTVCAVLFLLVLTNNIHGLVFVFEKNTTYDYYTYIGSLYLNQSGATCLLEIVPPQVCAISIGAVQEKPIVTESFNGKKEVKVGKVMPICIAFDHRALDFGDIVPFLKRLDELFENPGCLSR